MIGENVGIQFGLFKRQATQAMWQRELGCKFKIFRLQRISALEGGVRKCGFQHGKLAAVAVEFKIRRQPRDGFKV